MVDCKIDINDKEMPITFNECKEEFLRFFYDDYHQAYINILKFMEEMIDLEMITDDEDNTLNQDSKCVKDFMESDEAKAAKLDDELFDYLYDQLCTIEDLGEEKKWIKYYDEPDKRVFYRYDEGLSYQSTITDVVVEAPY